MHKRAGSRTNSFIHMLCLLDSGAESPNTLCILMSFLALKQYIHFSECWHFLSSKYSTKWLALDLIIDLWVTVPVSFPCQNYSKRTDSGSSFWAFFILFLHWSSITYNSWLYFIFVLQNCEQCWRSQSMLSSYIALWWAANFVQMYWFKLHIQI